MIQRLNAIIQENINPYDLLLLTPDEIRAEARRMANRIHERASRKERILKAIENDNIVNTIWSITSENVI